MDRLYGLRERSTTTIRSSCDVVLVAGFSSICQGLGHSPYLNRIDVSLCNFMDLQSTGMMIPASTKMKLHGQSKDLPPKSMTVVGVVSFSAYSVSYFQSSLG